MTEDEMVEWHHRSMDIEQPLGDGDGQGSLECCSPGNCKESDMTEGLNNTSTHCCRRWRQSRGPPGWMGHPCVSQQQEWAQQVCGGVLLGRVQRAEGGEAPSSPRATGSVPPCGAFLHPRLPTCPHLGWGGDKCNVAF